MDYFAGLDISMDETHVCVLDREGVVVRESKTESTAQAVANELAKAPSCRRIVFETGRMAPILFQGLSQLGLPVSASRAGRPTRGFVTGTVAGRGSAGKMADDDLICPPPVPACDHPARRLALCPFHAQLSRR